MVEEKKEPQTEESKIAEILRRLDALEKKVEALEKGLNVVRTEIW